MHAKLISAVILILFLSIQPACGQNERSSTTAWDSSPSMDSLHAKRKADSAFVAGLGGGCYVRRWYETHYNGDDILDTVVITLCPGLCDGAKQIATIKIGKDHEFGKNTDLVESYNTIFMPYTSPASSPCDQLTHTASGSGPVAGVTMNITTAFADRKFGSEISIADGESIAFEYAYSPKSNRYELVRFELSETLKRYESREDYTGKFPKFLSDFDASTVLKW